MKKFVCAICGYVHEGDNPPEFCPQCKAPASKFKEQEEGLSWAAEHVVGIAKGVDPEILEDTDLSKNNFKTLKIIPFNMYIYIADKFGYWYEQRFEILPM